MIDGQDLPTETAVLADFISVDEQQDLLSWAYQMKTDYSASTWAAPKKNIGAHATGDRYSLPIRCMKENIHPLIYDIRDRIIETYPLLDKSNNVRLARLKLIMHDEGAHTSPHEDVYYKRGAEWYGRTNIVIKAPSNGGDFVVDGNVVTFPERSLLGYFEKTTHSVTDIVTGNRVVLHYGWRSIYDGVGIPIISQI